ncbi:MAG: LysR family transcriptional regulator [Candidatus Obscuribacterales bacterium]|jgi:DNA-binding transcriptional LysR family regulator|nr:LysR family transcriptional regulator [Candidatus Obscuribacterales bacterium]
MVALPSLDTLNAFVVFAEKLNFTHAAESLNISQPALFAKIQDLSNQLNVPLYRKIGRRLELTQKGIQLSRFGREVVGRAHEFFGELTAGEKRESVVLASGEGAYLYLLAEPLRLFSRNSSIRLQLLTLNREGILDAIQSGKAQLGVASLESTPPGFKSHLLYKADQVLVMPKKHELAGKRKLKLKDLQGQRLVVPPTDRPHRQMLSMLLQSSGVDWEVAVEASGWELMLKFVQLEFGLAVVNSSCSIPAGLIARKLSELPQVHYHLFYLKGEAASGPTRVLRDELLAHFS